MQIETSELQGSAIGGHARGPLQCPTCGAPAAGLRRTTTVGEDYLNTGFRCEAGHVWDLYFGRDAEGGFSWEVVTLPMNETTDRLVVYRGSDFSSLDWGGASEDALRGESLSWEALIEAEPRLQALERDVMAVADKGGELFCANAIWYGYMDVEHGFKERVCQLAGWTADSPQLRTQEAYDLVYERLYDQLPNCRDCRCFVA
jgi:hypothetical protein